MEILLVLLAVVVVGGPWVVAVLAWRAARQARLRTEGLEARLAHLAGIAALRDELRAGGRGAAMPPAPGPAPAAPAEILSTVEVPAPDAAPPSVAGWGPLPTAAPAESGPHAAPPARSADPEQPRSLEEKVALVWFARIGALVFLLGAAYFFKYAVDNEWIGPTGRVALGGAAGAAALGLAEAIRARARALYVHAVAGTGVALLFVATYAASALYHLLPAPAAFAAVGVLSLLGGALALRHRAEVVLLLALAGGLLAPVLLSTGEDRPLALFGYLLLLSGLALAASARAGFAIAPWLALLGPAALFAGWHERFFDPLPPLAPPASGLPLLRPAGPYHALPARAVPLLFVGLLASACASAALAARRRASAPWTLPFLVISLSLAHAGAASLLPDHPAALSAALALLGLGAAAALERAGKGEWLAVPLVVSFLVLVQVARQPRGSPAPAVALLLLWAALYSGTFLRQARRAAEGAGARGLALAGAAGVAFTLVAGLLLQRHLLAFALLAVATGAAYAALAALHRSAPLAAGAAAVSLLALLYPAERVPAPPGLLWAGAAWAAVHLVAAAHALLRRQEPPTPLRLVVASAPGLGLLALALLVTGPEESLLRAAVAGAGAAADLALGAGLLRRARRRAAPLLGQALGLAAAAAAFLLSGATVTLAWAALAAVVAVLAAGEEDRDWLALAGLLFGAALLRLALVDGPAPARATALFVASLGKAGRYGQPVLWNARALSLAGTAVALAVSAWRLRATAAPLFRRAAGALVAAAHLLLLALLVWEVRGALFAGPVPPEAGDTLAYRLFASGHRAAVAAQAGRLGMYTTLVLGAYASLLVAVGFAARERLHRWLGLGLFAVTLGKLALWDVWRLGRGQQVAVLLAVGALLLAAAFLYARFGERLLGLLRGGGTLLLLLLPALCAGLEPARFDQAAPLGRITGPGLWRFEAPPALFRASRSGPELADLRIEGPDGAEVPWLLRELPHPGHGERRLAALLDPVRLPGGAARAVLDLGRPGLRHSEVRLELIGKEFLRRVRVESSDDGRRFGQLSEQGRVFAVAGRPERAAQVHYPTSMARYLRVTLLPGDGEVAIAGASVLDATAEEAHPVRRMAVALAAQSFDARTRRTFVDLDLGGGGLPAQAVVLATEARAFERQVRVHWSARRDWFVAGPAGLLWRAPDGPPEDRENLRLELGPVPASVRWIRLEIEDGDDAPLGWTGASVEWLPHEVVLAATRGGPHTVLVGAEGMASPAYDLAARLRRAPAPVAEAELLPLGKNPRQAAPAPASEPFTERHRAPLAAGLALLLALLAAWALRLLRQAR